MSQAFHMKASRAEDGRYLIEVPGTDISVIGTDEQAVMSEVNRRLEQHRFVGGRTSDQG